MQIWHLLPRDIDWAKELTGLRASGEQEVSGQGREPTGVRERYSAIALREGGSKLTMNGEQENPPN